MKDIYIEIKNGVVQSVYSDENMVVNIIDWDNAYCYDDEMENCETLIKEVKKKKLKDIL